MTVTGAVLALLMGVTLGLLGGGGSILAVPILLYVFRLEAKSAIATSLLVVGATSLVAMGQHARRGHVLWTKGLLFGAFAMLGAFGGGHLAAFIPGWMLLVLFAGMMLATALAMLRGNDDGASAGAVGASAREAAVWKVAVEGLLVGAFTGLVGAGGGFLIVPALVLLGGVPMRLAVGTSLLIISLKSFAGLVGYLSHVEIDPTIAAIVTVMAIAGSFAGAMLSTRAQPDVLRRAFGWFVLAMGCGMLFQQLDALAWLHSGTMALPLLGGVLIGLAASLLLLWSGRIAGISGILGGVLRPTQGELAWRVTFIAGLLAGGVLLTIIHPDALAQRAPRSVVLVALAGLLVGFGTRLGNGCTSGHGVCGMSRFSRRSILATATFIATGATTVYLVQPSAGGAP